MRVSDELQIGKAGEFLVCCDLTMKGYVAFLSDQGLPYDILVENGKRLLRIQVKTTTKPRVIPQRSKKSFAYIYNIKKHGKNNKQRYGIDEVDIFALVALDIMKVGYIIADNMPETINIRCDNLRGSYHDEKGILDYDNVMKLKGKMSAAKIAEKCGIGLPTVYAICQKGYNPYKTKVIIRIKQMQDIFLILLEKEIGFWIYSSKYLSGNSAIPSMQSMWYSLFNSSNLAPPPSGLK